MSAFAVFYPRWLTWTKPLSCGLLVFSGIGIFTQRGYVQLAEACLFFGAAILLTITTIARRKFRERAMAQHLNAGGDPAKLKFF